MNTPRPQPGCAARRPVRVAVAVCVVLVAGLASGCGHRDKVPKAVVAPTPTVVLPTTVPSATQTPDPGLVDQDANNPGTPSGTVPPPPGTAELAQLQTQAAKFATAYLAYSYDEPVEPKMMALRAMLSPTSTVDLNALVGSAQSRQQDAESHFTLAAKTTGTSVVAKAWNTVQVRVATVVTPHMDGVKGLTVNRDAYLVAFVRGPGHADPGGAGGPGSPAGDSAGSGASSGAAPNGAWLVQSFDPA